MCMLYSTQKMKGLPLHLWEHGLKHIDLQICRSWSSSLAISDHAFSLNTTFLLKPQAAQTQYDSLIINRRGLLMAVRLAYKSSSNFSQTRSASVKFFVFCGKSERESESSTCFPCKKSPQVTSFCSELFASLSRVSSSAVKVCQNKQILQKIPIRESNAST